MYFSHVIKDFVTFQKILRKPFFRKNHSFFNQFSIIYTLRFYSFSTLWIVMLWVSSINQVHIWSPRRGIAVSEGRLMCLPIFGRHTQTHTHPPTRKEVWLSLLKVSLCSLCVFLSCDYYILTEKHISRAGYGLPTGRFNVPPLPHRLFVFIFLILQMFLLVFASLLQQ